MNFFTEHSFRIKLILDNEIDDFELIRNIIESIKEMI